MPQSQKAAEREMQALTPEIRTAIEQRFGDVTAITDDVAKRMVENVAFPNALLQAVRERDPAFAKEIEQMLASAEEKKPAEAPKPEAEGKGVEVETHAARTSGGAAGELSVGKTVSLGEEAEASGKVGYVATKGKTDFSAAVDVSAGPLSVGLYRDPIHAVEGAAYAGAESEVGRSVTAGATLEAGVSEGEKYATFIPSIAYQDKDGNVNLNFSPMLTLSEEGEVSAGIDSSAGYTVIRQSGVSVDVQVRCYQADMVAGEEISFAPIPSAGVKGSF